MNLLELLFGRWSRRQRAMSLYQRAMTFANRHEHEAALADYTAVIEATRAPADVRAMALYNRSVVHSAMHDDVQAVQDLRKLLEVPGATANVRLEAKRKLLRMEQAATRIDRNRPPNAS